MNEPELSQSGHPTISDRCLGTLQHDQCSEVWCKCDCHEAAGGILHQQTIQMFGPIPAYVPYLHQLASAGHRSLEGGGKCRIDLCWIDRSAFDQLVDVNSVVLEYEKGEVKCI